MFLVPAFHNEHNFMKPDKSASARPFDYLSTAQRHSHDHADGLGRLSAKFAGDAGHGEAGENDALAYTRNPEHDTHIYGSHKTDHGEDYSRQNFELESPLQASQKYAPYEHQDSDIRQYDAAHVGGAGLHTFEAYGFPREHEPYKRDAEYGFPLRQDHFSRPNTAEKDVPSAVQPNYGFPDMTSMVNASQEVVGPMVEMTFVDSKVCQICNKRITRDMSRHYRTHQKEKRFVCVFPKHTCGNKSSQFNRRYDYKKHLLNKHFVYDDREIVKNQTLRDKVYHWGTCLCGQRFLAQTWLDTHILTNDASHKCPLVSAETER